MTDGDVVSTIIQYILHLRNWGCCQGRSLAEAAGLGWGKWHLSRGGSNSICEEVRVDACRRSSPVKMRENKVLNILKGQLLPADSTNIFQGQWPIIAFRSVNESAIICSHDTDQHQSWTTKWLWFRSTIRRGVVSIYSCKISGQSNKTAGWSPEICW